MLRTRSAANAGIAPPRRVHRVLRWVRRVLFALGPLLLLGVIGLAVVVAAWYFVPRRWPNRKWSWWSKVGGVLLASIAASLLGLWISSNAHATRLPVVVSNCPRGNLAVPEDMESLFNAVARNYGKADSIHLVQVGPARNNTVLVMLPGSVVTHMGAAIKAGLGVTGDKRVAQVNTMVKQFQQARNLPKGTWVIVAGHSYGGIIAQLIADRPHLPDYQVTAVVTWGAPSVSPRASGINYQQYFSHYDVVPELSTYELEWPVSFGGVLGGFADLVGMQISPALKGMHTGQTFVPDMGQYWWPGNWIHFDDTWNSAHDGYGYSAWLGAQTLAYRRGTATCELMTRITSVGP